ncbi:hypothetical protein Tco_0592500 [Tanacetum coccineum]
MSYSYWVIQALRYLMRFQTEYTCGLLNVARHSTFGWEAAELVHSTRISEYIEEKMQDSKSVGARALEWGFGDCHGGDATPLVFRCCPLTTLGVNMISGTSICEDPISDSKEESIEYVNGEFTVLMEYYVPLVGFFSMPSDIKSPLSISNYFGSLCHICDDKFKLEVNAIFKVGLYGSVSDPCNHICLLGCKHLSFVQMRI